MCVKELVPPIAVYADLVLQDCRVELVGLEPLGESGGCSQLSEVE